MRHNGRDAPLAVIRKPRSGRGGSPPLGSFAARRFASEDLWQSRRWLEIKSVSALTKKLALIKRIASAMRTPSPARVIADWLLSRSSYGPVRHCRMRWCAAVDNATERVVVISLPADRNGALSAKTATGGREYAKSIGVAQLLT